MTDLRRRIEREVVPGTTTLAELGVIIDAPGWLEDGAVAVVTEIAGKLPVQRPADGTVATVALPDGAALYVALDGLLGAAELAAGLRSQPGAERASSAIVRAVAVIAGG